MRDACGAAKVYDQDVVLPQHPPWHCHYATNSRPLMCPPLPPFYVECRAALHCNHKWALDGGDPASYAGVLWCFGESIWMLVA